MYKLFDKLEDYIIVTTLDDEILYVNEQLLKEIKKSSSELLGKKSSELILFENALLKKEKKGDFEYEEYTFEDSTKRVFRTKKEYLSDEKKEYLIIKRDISKNLEYKTLYYEHKSLLKSIAQGKELFEVLDEIIHSVESKNKNIICSILLLDESEKRLIKGAAPSLPKEYNEKINGMVIGEEVGSCGAAVFKKKRVVVEDISSHKNWQKAKNLAAKYSLKACWSQPILSSKNSVLGSFAIYYKKIKKPTPFDIDLIEDIASIAGIAIEKDQNELRLNQEMKQKLEQQELLVHKSKQAIMGEMLENIAHQWRQPLSIISTYATGILMKRECGIDTKELEKDAFETININAQYLSETIDNFRSYFSSKSEKCSFSIKESLEYTKKLISSRIKSEEVKLIESIEDLSILNYESELIQVFMNIFNNSLDAFTLKNIEKKSRYIHINTYKEDDKFVVIEIVDSANGVDEEIINRIFEPYFTTKHKSCGTGIGLYMVQEIIQRHMGGELLAENSEFTLKDTIYRGLKFKIRLPLK